MTNRSPVKTSRSPVKISRSPAAANEKPRLSPSKPDDHPWQNRRKRRRDGAPSMHDRTSFLGDMQRRLQYIDATAPECKAEYDDVRVQCKFAAADIKDAKRHCKWTSRRITSLKEDIAALKDQLGEAEMESYEAGQALVAARQDREDLEVKLYETKVRFLAMTNDRMVCHRAHADALNKMDGLPPCDHPVLTEPYLEPLDDSTDDECPSDHYVPSTPDYDV